MKKCVLSAGLIFIMLLGIISCGGKQSGDAAAPAGGSKVTGKTIGVIMPGPDVYYSFGKGGVKWAVEASGNTYVERQSDYNAIKEIQNVEDLISAGADAIIVMTTNVETGQKGAQIANAANVPYFLVDSSITDGPGKIQGRVDVDMVGVGRMLGEYVVQNKLGSGGAYLIVGGVPGDPGTSKYIQGFQEAMDKDPNYRMLSEIQYAEWDRKKGEDVMRNYLIMHNKIDLVYAMNEEMAFGANVAIKEAGREDEITLVTVNGSPVGKEMLQAGTAKVTVGWAPSEDGILVTIKALQYLAGTPEPEYTEPPIKLFTIDNIGEYSDWDVEIQASRYEPKLKELGLWN
ncbi:MAG: sugar ABC transporter substrate-binding protein [Treponema sp.]|jgi:inositol transport system substrate-binding protein|nr:sugar ABC transporter substrate-binding protein [Treponema sp.]